MSSMVQLEALNSIFQKWDAQAVALWNTTGDPCSGSAIDDGIEFEDPRNNPAIKCDCTYGNGIALGHEHKLLSLSRVNVLGLPATGSGGGVNCPQCVLWDHPKGAWKPEGANDAEHFLPNWVIWSNFEQIYINSCGLGGEIPSTFANLKSMRIMWASDSPFTGRIPDFIGNWTKLTSLRFQGNSFTGPIPSSFSNLTSLESLRIGDIYNVSSSLDFIKNLKSLSNLVLRNALITGGIPSDIGEYQSLQTLDLSFNNLTGEIPSEGFRVTNMGPTPNPSLYHLNQG
uniref:Leucine-rich repeat-containing N-terminal plant-type domain-containing protein n=1 Tax=Fagus sylvatica TaxID=28930 RepID=A0A2N9EKV8_FAGSY